MTIPILNTHQILQPNRVRLRGKRIEWRCSYRVHQHFRELLHELVELEVAPQNDHVVQQRMEALRDAIRHLPGFPLRFDPELDTIVPVTTSVSR